MRQTLGPQARREMYGPEWRPEERAGRGFPPIRTQSRLILPSSLTGSFLTLAYFFSSWESNSQIGSGFLRNLICSVNGPLSLKLVPTVVRMALAYPKARQR